MTTDNNNDSPIHSRILRQPTTQTSKRGQSNTESLSNSVLSPVNTQDGINYTPAHSSYLDTSPVSSPAVDPSMVAVRGSVPPSPILKARRGLKDSSYFNMLRANGNANGNTNSDANDWDQEKVQEDLAKSGSIDEFVESGLAQQGQVRTANTSRVIAIDCDIILPQGRDANEHTLGQSNLSMDESLESPSSPLSPSGKRYATSGLLLALKQLQALGHPLHLVTDRPVVERGVVIEFLLKQGISVGTKDQDIVAALWSAEFAQVITDSEEKNGLSRQGRLQGDAAKLKVYLAHHSCIVC